MPKARGEMQEITTNDLRGIFDGVIRALENKCITCAWCGERGFMSMDEVKLHAATECPASPTMQAKAMTAGLREHLISRADDVGVAICEAILTIGVIAESEVSDA